MCVPYAHETAQTDARMHTTNSNTDCEHRQNEYAVKIADALRLTLTAHWAHSACILMCVRQPTYRNLPLDTHSHAIYDFM